MDDEVPIFVNVCPLLAFVEELIAGDPLWPAGLRAHLAGVVRPAAADRRPAAHVLFPYPVRIPAERGIGDSILPQFILAHQRDWAAEHLTQRMLGERLPLLTFIAVDHQRRLRKGEGEQRQARGTTAFF